jgi:hypothetical protein
VESDRTTEKLNSPLPLHMMSRVSNLSPLDTVSDNRPAESSMANHVIFMAMALLKVVNVVMISMTTQSDNTLWCALYSLKI